MESKDCKVPNKSFSNLYFYFREPDNDFVLPLEDDLSRFLIRVDCAKFPRTNKSNCSFCGPMIYSNIIIENVSSPVAAGKFLVNGYQLNVNTKICIIGCCFHADIEFDSNTLSLARSIGICMNCYVCTCTVYHLLIRLNFQLQILTLILSSSTVSSVPDVSVCCRIDDHCPAAMFSVCVV